MKESIEYKYSGIEWIGEIPHNWDIVPITKYLDSLIDYRGRTPEKVDEGNFLVTARNIKNGKIDYNIACEYIACDKYDEVMSRGKPKIGDVLFTTEAPLGEVANVDDESIALAQRIIKFSGKENIVNNYFLKYWMLSKGFQEYLSTLSTGSTAEGIKGSKLFHLKMVLPPYNTQNRIVNFLDNKIEAIDKVIKNKNKLIELIKEERESFISEVVTKGINSESTKDSGIDWIGEVPSSWNVKRLRFIGSCQNGISKAGEHFGTGYPFVSYGDVYNNIELPSEVNGLVESTEAERENYSVVRGDVFFTRTSETVEEIAYASTCLHTIDNATFAGFLIRFRPNSEMILPEFSKYYFRSQILRSYFVKEMNLVTRASLSQDLLKNLLVVLPPIEEQVRIGNYLDKKNEHIDSVIDDITIQIEKLKEYRQAIISEVVTGKVVV